MPTWKPHPKQEQALLSECYEILYGGARGGGKTDAGIVFMLTEPDPSLPLPIEVPEYRGLVLRKNYTDLKDWTDRAMIHYRPLGGIIRNGDEIEFRCGAKIILGHLADDKSYMKYQGHEYQRELIEELTQIPSEELYLKILSSCRSTNPKLRPRSFSTANPGGPGHFWVKKRFVDVARPMTPFRDPVSGRTRVYIPARVDDNPTLMANDPDYVKFLDSLPPDLKAYWREGSWDYAKTKGAVFGDEMETAQREGRLGFAPYNPNLKVLTFWDLGLSKGNEQVCWFVQVDGQKVNLFDLEWGQNKAFDYWATVLQDKKYNYEHHYLPHDGTKRSPDSLRSFKDTLEAKGWPVTVITRTKDKSRDINEAKIILNRCYFNPETCMKGIEALTAYRFDWDDIRGTFSNEPYHDWTSNFADALMALAVTLEEATRPRADLLELSNAYARNLTRPATISSILEQSQAKKSFGFRPTSGLSP